MPARGGERAGCLRCQPLPSLIKAQSLSLKSAPQARTLFSPMTNCPPLPPTHSPSETALSEVTEQTRICQVLCPLLGLSALAALAMVDLSLEIRPRPHGILRRGISMPLAVPRLPDHSSCYFSHPQNVSETQGPVRPTPARAEALPPSKTAPQCGPWEETSLPQPPCPVSTLQSSLPAGRLPRANALSSQRPSAPPEPAPAGLSTTRKDQILGFLLGSFAPSLKSPRADSSYLIFIRFPT